MCTFVGASKVSCLLFLFFPIIELKCLFSFQSANPATKKLSMQKSELFLGEGSNGGMTNLVNTGYF